MEHKMTLVEEAKVDYFLGAYRELNNSLDLIEADLKMLWEEKQKLLAKFNEVREQDTEFKTSLEEKHGQGDINPGAYTFVTNE
jgi:hypothetical protein